jgi:AraC-like DNA-binding protein
MATNTAAGQHTILVTCVKAIGRALDDAGLNGRKLLMEAGFDLDDLSGPDTRCPLTKMGNLWRIALEATGDPAFGLKLTKQYKLPMFHALGYGLSASSTLKEAFERVQRFSHVVSDAVEYQFYRRGSEYHLIMHSTTDVPFESIDALVGMYIGLCRSLSGKEFAPLMVDLRRPLPPMVSEFEQRWRAPLRFGAPLDRLIFDCDDIERTLDTGNPELARQSDEISARYLARVERHNVEARVREVVMQRLNGSEPSQEEVASVLNMSARTLQRKLGGSHTTFKDIVDETRHTMALAYLSTPEHSIREITYLLGFSCTSSFTRAFRRWTGLAPSDWRSPGASRLPVSRNRRLATGSPAANLTFG